MDYSRLEKGIMDFIQEEQVKLGYRKEKIRLYYPLSSLKHFLGEEVSGKSTEELEKNFMKQQESGLEKWKSAETRTAFVL